MTSEQRCDGRPYPKIFRQPPLSCAGARLVLFDGFGAGIVGRVDERDDRLGLEFGFGFGFGSACRRAVTALRGPAPRPERLGAAGAGVCGGGATVTRPAPRHRFRLDHRRALHPGERARAIRRRRAGRSPETPAASDRTHGRRPSRPGRARHAPRAPAIRGRGPRRCARSAPARPSATQCAWSAPRDKAQARRAPWRIPAR